MLREAFVKRLGGPALSTRHIRRDHIALFLLFPLVMCTFDLMYAARDFEWMGLDSVTLQSFAFCAPMLGAFLLRKPSLHLTRLCACIALAAVGLMYFAPPAYEIFFCLIFDAALGFCYMVAVYVMMYRLNNAERLAGLLLHSLHYALSMMLRPVFQRLGSYALDYDIVYANAALFALALVFVLYHIGGEGLAEAGLGGTEDGDASPPRLQAGTYTVFVLVALYEFFTSTLAGLTYNTLMTNLMACGVGALVGAALILAAHIWLRHGSWHVWNLFLAATTVGVLFAFGRTYAAHSMAQGLISAGETFGMAATMYMVLGIGKKARHIAFFRWFCGLEALLTLLPVLVFQFDLDALLQTPLVLSLAAMAICLQITVLVAPILQRHLFTMEWADAFRQIDIDLVRETVEQASQVEYPDLTPREREVCALLLCGKTMRQIGAELSISQSTVNFHCHGLYRKMGVGSRTELFAKFSDRFTLTT